MQIGYHAAVGNSVDFGEMTKSDALWTFIANMSRRQSQHWCLSGSVMLACVYHPLCTQASFLAVLYQLWLQASHTHTHTQRGCDQVVVTVPSWTGFSCHKFLTWYVLFQRYSEVWGNNRSFEDNWHQDRCSGYSWDLFWENSAYSWVATVLVADGVQTNGMVLGKSFSKRKGGLPRSVGIHFFPSWCILFGSLL